MGVLDAVARGAAKVGIGFGGTLTLRQNFASHYDHDTGTHLPNVADYTMRCVIGRFSDNLFEGELVKPGDRRLIIEAASIVNAAGAEIAPRVKDQVLGMSGGTATIEALRTVYAGDPGGAVAAYIAMVRS
jgi:hypothetical protein